MAPEFQYDGILDPDYPESNQFHVSKGRVSGSVLGADDLCQVARGRTNTGISAEKKVLMYLSHATK